MIKRLSLVSLPILLIALFCWSLRTGNTSGEVPKDQKQEIKHRTNPPKEQDDPSAENARAPQSKIGISGSICFVINEVFPDSPAEQAGLQPGDVIYSIEGKQFNSLKDYLTSYTLVDPGTKILFTVLRRTEAGLQMYNVSIPTVKP